MTTANKITILRILLIPFFVVEMLYYVQTGNETCRLAGLLSFAVAAILDGVDGYIARRYHQWSELGTILDPLADKLLLVSAIVVLSFDNAPRLGQIPFWLTGTIIGRDLLLGIGAMVVRLMVGKSRCVRASPARSPRCCRWLVVIWILLKWDGAAGRLVENRRAGRGTFHRRRPVCFTSGTAATARLASGQFCRGTTIRMKHGFKIGN